MKKFYLSTNQNCIVIYIEVEYKVFGKNASIVSSFFWNNTKKFYILS